jgi:hypothetical protein
MNKFRLFGLSGLVVFIFYGLYLILITYTGDLRLEGGSFVYSEMNLLEKAFFIYQFPSLLFGWIYAEFKAYDANDKNWMIAILLIWPSFAYYLLKKVE